MKKIFFFAAIAALALSSCSSDELVQAEQPVEDGAVTFSAYAGRDTRAVGDPIADVAGLIEAGGFGVYAYEQGTADFNTYSASNSYPNFMYNQQVNSTDGGTNWTYSPIKYFSNNANAKHSFFAYAPYNSNVKAVFALGKAPSIRFTAGETTDLMYAEENSDNVDMEKPSITNKVTFNFKHGLSKIDFYVCPFIDIVHSGANEIHADEQAKGQLAKGTTVTVRSIKFVGNVPSQGLMSLKDGSWVIEATEESAYEVIPEDVNWDATSAAIFPLDYKVAKKDMVFIPADDVKIQIVYDVTTVDSDNPKNSSTVTNRVTSTSSFHFIKGTAYKFYLDLGLTSVKFNATVTNWNAESDYVDLPNNKN